MSTESDRLLIAAVRSGDAAAWRDLIARFEGRLRAFVRARIADPGGTDDVVQETFVGFARSLPNYDDRQSLENWLFSIAGRKVTDLLRKNGRRLYATGSEADAEQLAKAADDRQRTASSDARSRERVDLEARELGRALRTVVGTWVAKGDYLRVQVIELIFVKGWANKDVAKFLRLSEQDVANVRFAAVKKIKGHMRSAGLSADVFPELGEERHETRDTRHERNPGSADPPS